MTPIRRFLNHAPWCTIALLMFSAAAAAQTGWHKAGTNPTDYAMGTDTANAFTGTGSGSLKSNTANPRGFGTYMQTVDATEYRGKRVQLSAFVKSDAVADWAGVWMRVDVGTSPTAFDNMQNRPIRGTQGWTQHRLVLDVSPKATGIAFGILLAGKGSVWIDDVELNVVDSSVPVTDALVSRSKGPSNLNFETPPQP